MKNKH